MKKNDLGYDGRRPVPKHHKGSNTGHWHGRSKRIAAPKPHKGSNGRIGSPRMCASYDRADLNAAIWLAKRRGGVPLATILRDALAAYVKPFRVDLDAGREPIF